MSYELRSGFEVLRISSSRGNTYQHSLLTFTVHNYYPIPRSSFFSLYLGSCHLYLIWSNPLISRRAYFNLNKLLLRNRDIKKIYSTESFINQLILIASFLMLSVCVVVFLQAVYLHIFKFIQSLSGIVLILPT